MFFSLLLEGQNPFYRKYDGRNELPSTEINDVLQDDDGFLWFSTDHGLVRYDGYRFQTFDASNGLPENSVFTLRKDPQNRVWFVTLSGLLGYIHRGHITPYAYNDSILAFLKRDKTIYYTIFDEIDFEPDGSLWLSLRNKGIWRIDSSGNIRKEYNETAKPIVHLVKSPGGKIMVGSPNDFNPEKIVLRLDTAEADTFLIKDLAPHRSQCLNFMALASQNGDVYYAHNTIIIRLRKGKPIAFKNIKYNISNLRLNHAQNLLVSSIGGAWLLNPDLEVIGTFLPGEPISASLEDHEGGLWLTSPNSGIFYIPEPKNKIIATPSLVRQDKINSLLYDNLNRLWFSTNNYYGYYEDNKAVSFTLSKTGDTAIAELAFDSLNGRLWVGTGRGLFLHETRKSNSAQLFMAGKAIVREIGVKDLYLDNDGNLWVGLPQGVICISPENKVIFRMINPQLRRVEALAKDDAGRLWIGCNTGLYVLDGHDVSLGGAHPLYSVRITALKWFEGRLWAGTRENGLLIIEGDSIRQLTVTDGLLSTSVKFIEKLDTLLVLGTNKGVSVLSIPSLVRGKPALVQNIQAGYGLLSNEITAMTINRYNKIIAANTGFISSLTVNPDRILRIRKPVHILGVEAGSRIFDPYQLHYWLPYNENKLTINYFAISYYHTGPNTYRHRLVGLEKDWVINKQTVASYPYLPPGNYKFQLEVLNPDKTWNPVDEQIIITVTPPFWQKWWFVALMVVLGIVILFVVGYVLLRYIAHQRDLISKMQQYQQEALALQMNPHFLFNALNTVQRYILENDKLSSSRYLTRFAGFMRAMLENAQKPDTPIVEEAEMLRQYLELEAARKQPPFVFELKIDERIDAEKSLIPVFLIQPLVENAIQHGLKSLHRQGKIDIYFLAEKNNLLIQVQDNGIGRKAAAANQDSNKTSYGLAILQKRIHLINKIKQTNIRMQIEDLYNPSGEAAGTRVSLWFPGQINFKQNG